MTLRDKKERPHFSQLNHKLKRPNNEFAVRRTVNRKGIDAGAYFIKNTIISFNRAAQAFSE